MCIMWVIGRYFFIFVYHHHASLTVIHPTRHLEVLLFTYGRYLLFTSSRSVLPANLQGKWGPPVENAWSGDYRKYP